MTPSRILVGTIVGAQGLRGVLRVKSFTARPADLAAYGPLEDEAGTRRFALKVTGEKGGVVLARLDGVADRNQAEVLVGTRLYIERSALPEPEEDEYYHSDLIGLRAELADGSVLGTVSSVHDFGGGELIGIAGAEGERLLPFTRAVVPVIDLDGGRMVVEPPVEVGGTEKEEGEGTSDEAA